MKRRKFIELISLITGITIIPIDVFSQTEELCLYEIQYPNNNSTSIGIARDEYAETYFIDGVAQYVTDQYGEQKMVYTYIEAYTNERKYFSQSSDITWRMNRIGCDEVLVIEEYDKPNIYPNPTNRLVFINIPETTTAVYSLNGKRLLETKDNTIDMLEYPPGTYIFRITSNNKTITKKIIKL